MKAITLTNHELLQLKLLLRDIQLIQKMNSPFDDEAIEILFFKIIEHLNTDDTTSSQRERMYSEEEVLKILYKSHNAESTSIISNTLKKWFEQFKKDNELCQ